VRRAVKLARLDMRPESQREWLYVVRGRPDEALLLAAEYARREGLYDRAINTAERTSARHDYGLRYLMPFREQFAAAAQEQAVDVRLLFGIARQESRFRAGHRVLGGAVGLMQLMPPTAQWVAKQLNRADYPSVADIRCRAQYAVRRVLFQVLAGEARSDAAARRRRVQCRAGPRAGLARRDSARRRRLGRDDSVQRDPRLCEEGSRQRDDLRPLARSGQRAARPRLGTVQPRGRRGDRRHELS
jgi:hypothetical protein